MADQDDSNKSPWEEVLEEVPDNKPKFFGSLDDSAPKTPAGPTQLKVPTAIPEGVGTKVAADQAVRRALDEPKPPIPIPPIVAAPAVTVPKPAVPEPAVPKPNNPVASIPKPMISELPRDNPKPVFTPPAIIKQADQIPINKPKTGISALIQKITHPHSTPKPASPPVAELPKTPPVVSPATMNPIKAPIPQVLPNPMPPRPQNVPPIATKTPTPFSPPPPPTVAKTPLAPQKSKTSLFSPVKHFFTQPKVIIFEIIVVLLAGLIYFNETGFMSTGLEKVYGIVHLETLWGGLPADPQLALVKSFQQMKSQQSFSMDSEINFSVNSSSESNLTKPLLSLKTPIYLFALDKAMLAAVDQSDQQSQQDPGTSTSTTTNQGDTSASSTLSTDQPTGSTSTTTDTGQNSQDQATTSTSNTSLLKEFSSKANAYFSKDGAYAKIEVNNESGKQSNLNLVEQNSKLYLKTSNLDFAGSEKNWTANSLPITSGEILPLIFNSPNLSGFSITGKRLGSGTVNNIPVYRYQVNIKIGSILENIGIKDDMIDSIGGEVDLGKKDQLIHYAELVITPGVNSSIVRIDLKAALNDFGAYQQISLPDSPVEAATTTPAPAVTTTPTPAETSTPATGLSAGLLARDTQRKVDLRSIETALASYYQAGGEYPSTDSVVIKTKTKGNVLAKVLVPKYLSTLPVDPWTDKYYYGYKSDGTSYELSAVLGNNSDADGTMVGGVNLFVIKH